MDLAVSLNVTSSHFPRNEYFKILTQPQNIGLEQAAKGGDLDLINFFIQKGANWWDRGMCNAAKGGHTHLVHFFIEKGADKWSERSSNPTSERW